MDVKTAYTDGSARFAVLTVQAPAGDTAAMLALGGTPGAPLSLPVALAGQNVSVTLTGGVAASIDATQALTSAIAAGQATFWLRGPLASQARVDVPVVGAMHIIFDITAYSDGAVITDATVANDYAMGSVRRNALLHGDDPAQRHDGLHLSRTHPLSVSAVALDQQRRDGERPARSRLSPGDRRPAEL